jgi:hypothetical protein
MSKINEKNIFSGFTIVEAIVAVGIISFAVVGPLSAAKKGLTATSDSRDQSRLVFLAEEGLEFVRMIIDQNVYNGVDWLTDLDDCLDTDICGVATLNYSNSFPRPSGESGIVPCSSFNDCEMKTGTDLVTEKGFYTYNNNVSWDVVSGIKRKINVVEIVDNKEVEISVSMSARRPGMPPRVFTSKVRVFNWKHQPYSI